MFILRVLHKLLNLDKMKKIKDAVNAIYPYGVILKDTPLTFRIRTENTRLSMAEILKILGYCVKYKVKYYITTDSNFIVIHFIAL